MRRGFPTLALFYAFVAVSHALVLPEAVRTGPIALAAATSAAMLALWARLRTAPGRGATTPTGLAALLVVANSAFTLAATGEPSQTTNLMIALITAGFIVLSTPWFALVVVASLGSWLASAWTHGWTSPWVHYAFALVSTAVAASLIHVFHRANLERLETLRISNEEHLRRAEATAQRAHASESNLRLILTSAGEGVLGLDADGRATFINPAALRMLRLREEDVAGRNLHGILHPAHSGRSGPVPECPLAGLGAAGEPARVEEDEFWRPDGTRFPVRYVATPLPQNGGPGGIVVVVEDISRQQQAASRLRESEERFRRIFEHGPFGLTLLDLDMRVVRANATFCRLVGRAEEDLIGARIADLTHPDDRAGDRDALAALLEQGAPSVRREKRYVRPDGTFVWAHLVGSVLHDDDGAPRNLISMSIDVTAQRRAREELARLLEERESMIAAFPDVVYQLDIEGRLTRWNPRLAAVTGHAAEELLHRHALEFFAPAEQEKVAQAIARVYQEGSASVEARLLHRDGTSTPYQFSGAVLRDARGRIIGITGVGRDISEQRAAQDRLAAALHERQSIMDAIPDPLYVLDAEGRLVLWNRCVEHITGLGPESLRGRLATDFVPPEQGVVVQAAIDEARTRGTGSFDIDLKRPDGTLTPYSASIARILGPDGEVTSFTGAARDMTEIRRAQEDLAHALREREAIMEAIPDIIFRLDPSGAIRELNSAGQKALGHSLEELQGRSMLEFVPPDERDAGERVLRETLLAGRSALELDLLLPGERRAPYAIVAATIRDEKGDVLGITGVGRDATERRRWENEIRSRQENLEHLAAELKAANRELETFSYTVAHDLKAPLRALLVTAERLHEGIESQLGKDKVRLLDQISAEGSRMRRLVEDLLRLSRASEGSLVRAEVDLTTLARGVIAELSARGPGRAVEVHVAEGLQARADPELAHVVIENLLSNAWKYTAKRPDPRIVFGRLGEGGPSVFYVRDNGAGFDMRKAGRLFEPFQRLHSKKDFEGTGIGLATVARIVRRHGGRIWAESEPGQGATFYFTFAPSGEAREAQAAADSARSGRREERGRGSEQPSR